MIVRTLGAGALVLALAACGSAQPVADPLDEAREASAQQGGDGGQAGSTEQGGADGAVKCADAVPMESELPTISGGLLNYSGYAGFVSAGAMETGHDVGELDRGTVGLLIDIRGDSALPYREGSAIATGDVEIWRHTGSAPHAGECTLLDGSPEVSFGGNQKDGRITTYGAVWEVRTEALRDYDRAAAGGVLLAVRTEHGEEHILFDDFGTKVPAAHHCATTPTPPMWC